MKEVYPGLINCWSSLQFRKNPAVLVPLCGKSNDLLWLSHRCSRVVGVEISEIAIHEFLAENNLSAATSSFAGFTVFHTHNIQIWQGDFFKLPQHKLPRFDMIYDKAAFIALPPDMREKYAAKIMELASTHTQILLHHFEYIQEEMAGPPFSVSFEEIEQRFEKKYTLHMLNKRNLDLNNYKKFQYRGLRSYFIEILSLLLPKEGNKNG